jgi:hypothetical protein
MRSACLFALGTLVLAVLGCPPTQPAQPPAPAPAQPKASAQQEIDKCKVDGGELPPECVPEGCALALAPDAAPSTDPEPDCSALLAE